MRQKKNSLTGNEFRTATSSGSSSDSEQGQDEHGVNKLDLTSSPPSPPRNNNNNHSGTRSKGAFWPRVWKDLCDKELLPLKILFFIKAGTVFVLYPYLNLHLKTLGLDADEAGVSNAMTILTIVGQPLAGMISDKLGNFKVFLAVITILTPIPALLMLAIPVARETVDLPHNMTYIMECGIRGGGGGLNNFPSPSFTFKLLDGETCDFLNNSSELDPLQAGGGDELMMIMPNIQCGYLCDAENDDDDGKGNRKKSNYPSLEYLPVEPRVKYSIPSTSKSFITFENLEKSLLCVRESNNHSSSSSSSHSNGSSSRVSPDICEFHVEHAGNQSWIHVSSIDFTSLRNESDSSNRNNGSTNEVIKPQFTLTVELTQPSSSSSSNSNGNMTTARCESRELARIPGCEPKCLTMGLRKSFCSNTKIEKVYNEVFTFWTYNVLRVILILLSSTCWIMFEGAVLAIMKEKNGDYGIQRASSYLAAIIAAPASGFMISYFHDFRPAFYLYTVLQVLSGILTMKIHLDFKKPAEQVFGSLLKLLRNVQVIGLLFAVLFSGIAWGFLESFLFWYLQNLGGGGLLMGLTITVGGIAGLPFLILNKPIIDRLGHVHVIAIGLIFYGIRLIGYSFIDNPWMCLPYEALEAVTSSLAITAANTYGALLASQDTVVSFQGIIGALYYSVGRSVGGLVGGYLIKYFGERSAYKIMAIGSSVAGILYLLFNLIHKYLSGNSGSNRRQELKIKASGIIQRQKTKQQIIAAGSDKLDPLKFDGGYVGPFSVNQIKRTKITDIP